MNAASQRPWWRCVLASICIASFSASSLAQDGTTFPLSPDESAWTKAHPRIRVGYDPAWPPFSVRTETNAANGIDPDLLNLLGRRLGIEFEFVPRASWTEIYADALRGDVDLLVGTARTPEREQTFLFSQPYFSFPVVIVTRNNQPILWSVLDLEGQRIVGVRDYVVTTEMQRMYPHLVVETVESAKIAMQMVSDGGADAFVTNLPNASFAAKTQGLTNLKIAGVMPDRFDLCYAIRRDWPELVPLMNRAIASLTEAERQQIVHTWIRVDYEKVIRWDLVWKVGLAIVSALGLVIGLIAYRNRLLGRELRERIRLQTEIKTAHDELLELNHEKTELLQMAAHDLRGPLTGMQLAIDSSLRLKAIPGPDALEMIEKQIRQMTALLNNLLDVEALEHGRREFRLERITPDTTVKAAVAALQPGADHKGIRIQLDVADELPLVEVDVTALRQIADNLVSNALKFSPPGSTVNLVLERREKFVRLEIRDEGPGVSPDETERIFAKYARGSARPTAGEKSTGLGLSIVRQLAGAMNARVWCEATGGRGGLFVLMIPVADSAARGGAA